MPSDITGAIIVEKVKKVEKVDCKTAEKKVPNKKAIEKKTVKKTAKK